mmetsp:Transcript_19739/g.50132  ORF Transcript_19739/g.50132 Transcript_19739/m.50132 type:complete len:217 (+) Transcript_19739:1720-2370(+)
MLALFKTGRLGEPASHPFCHARALRARVAGGVRHPRGTHLFSEREARRGRAARALGSGAARTGRTDAVFAGSKGCFLGALCNRPRLSRRHGRYPLAQAGARLRGGALAGARQRGVRWPGKVVWESLLRCRGTRRRAVLRCRIGALVSLCAARNITRGYQQQYDFVGFYAGARSLTRHRRTPERGARWFLPQPPALLLRACLQALFALGLSLSRIPC